MESLITVLKVLAELQAEQNGESEEESKTKPEIFFQGQIITVLILNNSPQGPVNSEHLTKILIFCYGIEFREIFFSCVLNFAILIVKNS